MAYRSFERRGIVSSLSYACSISFPLISQIDVDDRAREITATSPRFFSALPADLDVGGVGGIVGGREGRDGEWGSRSPWDCLKYCS